MAFLSFFRIEIAKTYGNRHHSVAPKDIRRHRRSLDPNSSGKASSHNGYINCCWPMISLGIILPTILGIIIIHELGTPMNIQFLLKWLMTLRFSLGFAGNLVPIFSGWSLLRPRFKGHFFFCTIHPRFLNQATWWFHQPMEVFIGFSVVKHRPWRRLTIWTMDMDEHGNDAEATWLSNHITSCILYIYNIYI